MSTEKQRAIGKAKYQKNKEAIKARTLAYYWANHERELVRKRAYHHSNREHSIAKAKSWAAAHPAETAKRGRYWAISKKYGMSEEQYQAMLTNQGGACAICKKETTEGKNLCVDHDHTSGIVRGLLCRNCNAAIGQLGDSVEMLTRAINYLTNPTSKELK